MCNLEAAAMLIMSCCIPNFTLAGVISLRVLWTAYRRPTEERECRQHVHASINSNRPVINEISERLPNLSSILVDAVSSSASA